MLFRFKPSIRIKPKLGGLYFNMWRHAAEARFKLGLSWLMLVGAALMELLSPWLGAQALNELQKNGTQALSTAAFMGWRFWPLQ